MGCPPTIRALLIAVASLAALVLPAAAAATPVSSASLAALLGPSFSADTINAGDAAPDGQHILFRVRGTSVSNGASVPTNDIYVVRADGTELTQLTDSTQSSTGLPLTFAVGTWWNDSATFWITRFDPAQRGNAGVLSTRTLTLDGGRERWPDTVVNPAGGLQRSQLTPDGRYLVWSTQFPGSTPFTTYFALSTATRAQTTILGFGGNAAFAPGGVAVGCPASLSDAATDAFGGGAFDAVVAALTGPNAACDLNRPAPTPTLAPAPTPQSTPAPLAAPISQGPSLRLASVVKSLEQARRRGLALRYDADGATKLQAWLLLKAKTGRLKAGATLARASVARPGSAAAVLRLPLTAPARETLERRARVAVTLRLVATDAVGNRTVLERDVTLRD